MSKSFCTFRQKFQAMTKVHFRPYITNQIILFPQRIDEDIAENDPVSLYLCLYTQYLSPTRLLKGKFTEK